MEPRFEVQTVYSKEYINKLYRTFAKRPKYRRTRLIYLIGALIYLYLLRHLLNPVVIRGLFSSRFFDLLIENPIGVLALALSPVLVVYCAFKCIFMVRLDAHRKWKEQKKYEGTISPTSFFDDHLSDLSNKSRTTSFSYEEVTAIEESDDFFFIFYMEANAIIIAKSDFTIGTPDDFRAFIVEKTGKKVKFIR